VHLFSADASSDSTLSVRCRTMRYQSSEAITEAITVCRRLEISPQAPLDLGFKCVGPGSPQQMIGEALIAVVISEFLHSKGRRLISPSNEVYEHPLLGAPVGGCYFFAAAASVLASAAAFALAAAAAAWAGPSDAITVSRLKDAAFWRGGNLMKFATWPATIAWAA
jgi:hypothetical protein